MIKNMSVVKKGLVVDVGRFEKSQYIEGWVVLYSEGGERIGGVDLLDNKLQVIHKNKFDDNIIYLSYAIKDREVINNEY